jgi:RecB family exonuclease
MRLLGLASRTWPRRRGEDPLLPDHLLGDVVLHERSAPQRDRDHFAALLAAARDEVVLSRPRRGGDGRRQAPSPLVRPWKDDEAFRRPRDPGAHPMSAADRRASRPSELASDPVVGAARRAWDDWRRPEATAHDGLVRPEHPALVRAVGRVHSATSLRLLLRDPFAFMARYALAWKEPVRDETPFELDALAFGDLLHRVLQAAVVELEGRGGFASAAPADLDRAIAAATDAVADAWAAERPVPPRLLWSARLQEVRALAAAALTHPFAPLPGQRTFVEVPFGRQADGDDAPPVPAPWAAGTPVTVAGTDVEVRGYIDRLDLDARGARARVVDYKSGKARAGSDLDEGQELQRVLYANAVRQLLGRGVAVDAYLLHPRAGEAIALDDPGAALEQLTRALQAAFAGLRAGRAVPGPDAFGGYPPFPIALPAETAAYAARKADAFAAALEPVLQALSAPEGAGA